MFEIRVVQDAEAELGRMRPYDRRRVMDAMERSLHHEPMVPTRNRRMLSGLIPPWDTSPPVWELRVGEFRVFYDVDTGERTVIVRALHRKPPRADDGGDPVKTVTVRSLQKRVKWCVDASQRDRVVITRHGRPAAVLTGVEGKDWEDVVYETSGSFWRMIHRRRGQKAAPLADVRKRLG